MSHRPSLCLLGFGLAACSHADELDALDRLRSSAASASCEVSLDALAKADLRADVRPAEPGLQLALGVTVGSGCGAGKLVYGVCQVTGAGTLEPSWAEPIDAVAGGHYDLVVTLSDQTGLQTPCVKLAEQLFTRNVERTCSPDSEVSCASDQSCHSDTASNALRCGSACTVCPGGDNGQASCSNGVCGLACQPGYHYEAGACRARPACKGLETACRDDDCCAQDLIAEAAGQPLRFVRGYDASNNGIGLPELQPASSPPVVVEPFYMDRYEVTVGRFRAFVDGYDAWRASMNPKLGRGQNPRVPTSGWNAGWGTRLPLTRADLVARVTPRECGTNYTWTDQKADRETLPINCVDFFVAALFCLWDGDTSYGRLPSEAEWNAAAAGGGQQRAYPWSVEPASLDIEGRAKYGQGDRLPYEVGASPEGRGRWGTQDLSGNVYEWVRDTGVPPPIDAMTGLVMRGYNPYIDSPSDPINLMTDEDPAQEHVLRGGSFKNTSCPTCDPRIKLRTASRTILQPFKSFNDTGFRCVRNY